MQTPRVVARNSEAAEPWLPSPQDEARMLFSMIGRNGDSVDTIRELIAVPPEIETALRAFAREHREEQKGIERILRFRKAVLEEFEGLVRRMRVAPVADPRKETKNYSP